MNKNIKLNWKYLLSEDRMRLSATSDTVDCRNEFDKDYDRIVYSSSVRRLQDKAQVFPLQENDFPRTRLTHSIEVSALARSFGYSIGTWLLKQKDKDLYFDYGFCEEKQIKKLATMLQTAALVHDLGNPPFGHYGEAIIRKWFSKFFDSEKFNKRELNSLSKQQKNDFLYFEGNAQTLRILSKLQMLNDEYGINFTYGTLATIIKYPWNSCGISSDKKKFGYFFSEEKLVEKVFSSTGLNKNIKHPATFLLEAADDIAYLTADIEDGVKKGIVPWNKEYEKIKNKLENIIPEIFQNIEKKMKAVKEKKIPNDNLVSIQNFKIFTQSYLFKKAISTFKDNYNDIMTGNFKKNLLYECKDLVDELKRIAQDYCYSNEEVIQLELLGDSVLNGLLDKFISIVNNPQNTKDLRTYEGKIYNLISENFKYYCCLIELENGKRSLKEFTEVDLYNQLLLITDYISGMTDSFALNLYKKLIGVKLY